jgi:Ca2+/H+ antiporter
MPTWTWAIPVVAVVMLVVALVAGVGVIVTVLSTAALVGAVIASVHHAEVIAHRIGEPFGTLVLAVAVTVIEASLILSMVIAGGAEQAHLPRDTIYAALMIILNGVVGICLLAGGLRHGVQSFASRARTPDWPRCFPWRRSRWSFRRSPRPRGAGRTATLSSPSPRRRPSFCGPCSSSCRP